MLPLRIHTSPHSTGATKSDDLCLSRQDGEDIFAAYHRASQAEERCEYGANSRLVEILREENTSLKQELETYYQRVRKLQKVNVSS